MDRLCACGRVISGFRRWHPDRCKTCLKKFTSRQSLEVPFAVCLSPRCDGAPYPVTSFTDTNSLIDGYQAKYSVCESCRDPCSAVTYFHQFCTACRKMRANRHFGSIDSTKCRFCVAAIQKNQKKTKKGKIVAKRRI
jgi:hypothetical protein